jgi:hypothetical protein
MGQEESSGCARCEMFARTLAFTDVVLADFYVTTCKAADEDRELLAARDEALAETRTMLGAVLAERDELLARVARLQVQLRDEERENGALRRRLREGGR